MLGYHITSKAYLESILKEGLVPKSPSDFGDDGDTKAVYLFKTRSDAETALLNWMGERLEEQEEESGIPFDEVCLVVDLTGFEMYFAEGAGFEIVCTGTIPPERIISVDKI